MSEEDRHDRYTELLKTQTGAQKGTETTSS